ncbi:tetratricopeptide repeat protein [candidate division KSB1 bacterium]|nr:tetratricopeptide repeat protein [candidate division KSB1 bacterium]
MKSRNRNLFPKPGVQSLLAGWQKRLLIVTLFLAVFILANSAYLLINRLADLLNWHFLAAGKTSLPRLFQVMILSHTGVGLLLVILFLTFAIVHLPRVWRRRHKGSIISGLAYVTMGLVLAVTGLFILTAAASRNNQWAWWTHVICALLAPIGYILHRVVSYTRPQTIKFRRFFVAVASVTLFFVLWHVFTNQDVLQNEGTPSASGPDARNRDVSEFSKKAFVPAGYVPPESRFFPSAATTTSGGYLSEEFLLQDNLLSEENLTSEIEKHGLVRETLIGAQNCVRCHQDIAIQWAASAHRFASFNNPFYEATVQDLRKYSNKPNSWINAHLAHFPKSRTSVGKIKSKWCGGCHDPALMFTNKMTQNIDRTSAEAQAGLTCLACHAIDKIHNQTGNGNYNLAEEKNPYIFEEATSGSIGRFLHDSILKAKPTAHKRQMLKPFFRRSEFCAPCHKVSLTEPVNNYRWLRGQNEYDSWHDSGVALNASRTFYLPEEKRRCQDCHMPPEPAVHGDLAAKNGYVKSHRFLAVNTALPFVREDQKTIERIETFLRSEKLRVDIFAIKAASLRKPFMAIGQTRPNLPTGEKVTVDVVVRNKGVGHTFPGGTNDSNEGWLEFSVRDGEGNLLGISGWIGQDGHLEPMAHLYKALILDKNGKPIHKRNAQDIHVTVFANVIKPGTADLAHYEFVVPPELAGKNLTLQARLLWRKFDRKYTEFAFYTNPDGFRNFESVPNLPITEIARDEITLPVHKNRIDTFTNGSTDQPSDWQRFNDYGIGLLMEGDTRGAALAFQKVSELQPSSIEGDLNLAKTAVNDGNLGKAYEYLNRCENIDPGNARVAWVWGVALQEEGQYEKAIMAYKRVLEQFPQDRAAWRNLGRACYLNQNYKSALQALSQVLQIDPEDRIAHYHRMLCFRALGKHREAKIAEAAYEYYQIDESAQEITRAYRLKNPGANLMAQKIRTHTLDLNLPGTN